MNKKLSASDRNRTDDLSITSAAPYRLATEAEVISCFKVTYQFQVRKTQKENKECKKREGLSIWFSK